MMVIPRTKPMPTTKEALTVYLDAELKEKLATWAREDDRSMAYLAARAIEKAVLEWETTRSKSKS